MWQKAGRKVRWKNPVRKYSQTEEEMYHIKVKGSQIWILIAKLQMSLWSILMIRHPKLTAIITTPILHNYQIQTIRITISLNL